MRRIFTVVCTIVAIIIICLIALPWIVNVNRYRPEIQAELQKKLNRPVTLGKLTLRVFPLSIRVNGITIGEAPQFPSSHPFATANEVYASANFWSLLRGSPELTDVTLDNPQIELIRNAQGVWNYSTLGASNAPSNGPGIPIPLNQLKVIDGQVAVTNYFTHQPRSIYKHINMTLSDFAPNKPFTADLSMQFPGPGTEKVAFNGKIGPIQPGDAATTPVNGTVSIQQVSLAGINTLAPGTVPAQTNAVATGSADVHTTNEILSLKGNLKLENPVIRGYKLNYPINADYDLSDNRKQDVLQIHAMTIKLGPTPLSLSGSVNSSTTPANVDLHLTTTNASLEQISQMMGAFNPSMQGLKGTGSLSLSLDAKGPADMAKLTDLLTGTGKLSANNIQAQDIVLTNVHSDIKLNHGVVQLQPLTANLFGGNGNGALTLDLRPTTPVCSLNAKLSGVDTNSLLSAVSSAKNTLYGALAANANVNFGLVSSAELPRTLNGTFGFNVSNGELKNVNILNEISKVGKFLGAAPAQKDSGTKLSKLSGTFDIKNGVATTNDLVAAMNEASLSANGSLNLANQALNMHVNAVLASGLSKTVGGTGIGGYLNTALANNKGELVIPAIVTGTLSHPVFMPDVQAIAKMKLSHLLPSTNDPGKLASGILGSALGNKGGTAGSILNSILGGGKNQQNQNEQQNKQNNGLNSLFDKLGKKKKPQ